MASVASDTMRKDWKDLALILLMIVLLVIHAAVFVDLAVAAFERWAS